VSWGVYISGPGIAGRLLIRSASRCPILLVFTSHKDAQAEADKLSEDRPYHHVFVRAYKPGDENRGEYARRPDGAAP
jgi:hypothetical protein